MDIETNREAQVNNETILVSSFVNQGKRNISVLT